MISQLNWFIFLIFIQIKDTSEICPRGPRKVDLQLVLIHLITVVIIRSSSTKKLKDAKQQDIVMMIIKS